MGNHTIRIHPSVWNAVHKGSPEIFTLAKHYHAAGRPETTEALWHAGRKIQNKSAPVAGAPSNERS